LVRGSRIIVCDEATSSVDFETDALVQRSMKEGFEGRTLLVIGKFESILVSGGGGKHLGWGREGFHGGGYLEPQQGPQHNLTEFIANIK
jgi:hypothetical protein